MSKTKVHVLIPFTTQSACGEEHYVTAMYKEKVTCSKCKKTVYFKYLKTLGKVKNKRSK